jgi:hypothetical protein
MLSVTQLVKEFPFFIKPERALPWSQDPAACSPHLHTLVLCGTIYCSALPQCLVLPSGIMQQTWYEKLHTGHNNVLSTIKLHIHHQTQFKCSYSMPCDHSLLTLPHTFYGFVCPLQTPSGTHAQIFLYIVLLKHLVNSFKQ